MNRLQLLIILTFSILCLAQCSKKNDRTAQLRTTIEQITAGKNAIVGVSIIGNDGQDTLSIHGDRHFPMQSVFKYHIALAVLSEIDKGHLSLNQEITITKEEFLPEDNWNPLRDENPEGGKFTIARLIQYTVAQSDNLACDILIRLIGTPKTVENYFKENGIEDLQITFNEMDMQANWDNMFQNWTTPKAATSVQQLFYKNKNQLMSTSNYEFFWQTNKETITGKNRIPGLLPKDVVVAHKTGSSGTNKETGVSEAVNDMGVVFLPNGKYFIISIFVTNSTENFETNERIIAEIAKATYDFFLESNQN